MTGKKGCEKHDLKYFLGSSDATPWCGIRNVVVVYYAEIDMSYLLYINIITLFFQYQLYKGNLYGAALQALYVLRLN